MVLYKDVDALGPCRADQLEVLIELLDGRLGEENVDASLDGVLGNGIMAGIGREDGDGIAGLETVNGGLVGVGILDVVGWERVEGAVEPVVDLCNVFIEVLA